MNVISFNFNNFIKSYQFFAFPLGILATNDIAYNNWLLGRFIGVTFGAVLQYDEEAYDDWEIINQNLYKHLIKDDIYTLVKNIIDNNHVLHLWGINEKYIPYTSAYQNYDQLHDLLITGYDEFDNITIVNYGIDRSLSQKTISINDLKNSFTSTTQGRSFNIVFDQVTIMDPQKILDNIKQYIYPPNIFQLKYYDDILNPKHEMLVGIHAIKEFINTFKNCPFRSTHLHGISILTEHKTSIMNSLVYLNNINLINSKICQDYNEILLLSKKIKRNYLKAQLTGKQTIINQIILDMDKMVNDEIRILNSIFNY